MDLFGQNILDFPSTDDTLFLGRLPRISESEYLQDLGLDNLTDNAENINENRKVSLENDEEWSNDSAIYSEDANSDMTDTNSEIKSNVGSELGDEDSYLYSAVSFDQICKQDTRKSASNEINDAEEVDIVEPETLVPSQKTVESITFDDVIEEDITDVVPLGNEDIGIGLDDSGYLGSGSQDGQGTNFCNEELLAGASLLITSNLVPDIDHIDQFDSSSSHTLPDVPTSVPDLHVPMSLDQMLSDSDDLSETEDVLKTIDLNDVLKQKSTSEDGSERGGGEKSKSAFEGLFDDFKNYCDNAEKSIDIKEELHSISADSEETDYGLEQFDFDLCNATDIEKTDLPSEEEVTSHIIDDFLTSMFGDDASEDANDYNDLLNSILTEENINTDYFNDDDFNIDSVDPSCTNYVEAEKEKSIKTEVVDPNEPPQLQVNIKKEPEEEYSSDNFYWLREHDYSLPVTSSLFLTPPHSPGDDFEEKLIKKSLLVRKNLPNKARSQIVKFNKPKDLKFVMTLPVKGGEKYKKVNARSILKNKILHHNNPSGSKSKSLQQKSKSRSSDSSSSQSKTAKELVREILEKRNLAQHIQEKKEFVRNMKKRMREETQRDLDREEFSIGPSKASKAACLEDLRTKGDLKKYRKFEEERELHNSMERQRRIEMKDAYDVLKATIPSIKDNDKVSKLNILNTARDYYLDLEALVRRTIAAKQRELDRRKYLMEKINLLKLQII